MTAEDVIYNDLPMYHVAAAIANVTRAAWVGCEVAMWNRFSPTEFWNRIAVRSATTAILIDVMIPWIMAAPVSPQDPNNTLNKVHMQPLPADHHDFARRWGIDFVTTGFGQTESGAALAVLIEELDQDHGTPAALYRGRSHADLLALTHSFGALVYLGTGPIPASVMGAPIPFLDVAVLDENDNYCRPGQPGQLAVRPKLPHMVMCEYLGKAEATMSAWTNLWLHTGDAAVEHESGIFCFVDRLGDRLRVRGENLSSYQVEDMLNQHHGVAFSAVVAVPGREGGEDDIAAFAVAEAAYTLTENDLREFVAATLPKYMQPRHLRIVTDIPRTPTMKIEKYKLRQTIQREIEEAERGSQA